MSTLTENIPSRLGRKMNVIKVMATKYEKKTNTELPSRDNFDDTPIPSMSSEEEAEDPQLMIDADLKVETHRRSNGGKYKSSFQPLPSPPTVLPRTLKCNPPLNVGCTIDVEAVNEADQRSSHDVGQDVISTEPQIMKPEDPQIQREQPLSTDVPSKENKSQLEFATEDEEEFNGCCEGCLYYTIRCCDFFSFV